MSKKLLFTLVALVAAVMCALGVSAAETYACYTPTDSTLTFYCDNYRSSRSGRTYDLNTGNNFPSWLIDSTNRSVTKAVFDPSLANACPTTTRAWFYGMSNLRSFEGMNYLNTSEVTNMRDMFVGCTNLTSLDLSSFNTSQVTTMENMFDNCTSLINLDLSNFNTSQVTDMDGMFCDCSSLTSLNVSSFNTANVTSMHTMFGFCYSLTRLDLSSFNTSQVHDMSWMFYGSKNLRTIYVGNDWSTAALWSLSYSSNMFKNCTSLVGGLGTPYNDVYTVATYAHIDGGSSNPGYFTDINGPEAYVCYTPENTTLTFYYDKELSSRPGTIYNLNTSINTPDWETDGTKSHVTNVVFDPSFADFRPKTTFEWFNEMGNLQTITGLNYLNTSEVFYMGSMFYGCNKLTSLDVSHFNTSKVTRMGSMFFGCSGLTILDLSSFNTAKVTNMWLMFQKCSGLTTIYVGDGWSTAAVSVSGNMFLDCTNLVGGQGTAYDASKPKDKTYAHIDGGPDNPGYFTEKPMGQRGDVNGDGQVDIEDVTALISLVLNGGEYFVNADVNEDSSIDIEDVTALINYILNGHWNF